MFPTIGQAAQQAQAFPRSPYPDSATANALGGANAPSESELQYASRVASESLGVLEKSVHELAARLQVVLEQSPPTPTTAQDSRATRSLSSQIANALMAHATNTDNITAVVRDILRRLAL